MQKIRRMSIKQLSAENKKYKKTPTQTWAFHFTAQPSAYFADKSRIS